MKTLKPVLSSLMIVFSLSVSHAQDLHLLIGTSTKAGKSEGLYVYTFNMSTGKASYKSNITSVPNALYVAVSKDQRFIYAVNQVSAGKGMASALSFNKNTGTLSLLNQQSTKGGDPCYVSVDKKSKHIFVANYGGGTVGVLPILKDGSLKEASQTLQYKLPEGVRGQAHAHCAALSPNEKQVFVSDLSNNRIISYSYLPGAAAPLNADASKVTQLPASSGPRMFEFHPNKKYAYSIQEISAKIIAFSYQKDTLAVIQSISTLADGFTGRKWPAELHISPDGKFLYASNRDSANEIAIFAIQADGTLVSAGRQPSLGLTPRSFTIDPSGTYLLVANQASDVIVIFKRDKKTGQLSDTGNKIDLGSPTFLKFVEGK